MTSIKITKQNFEKEIVNSEIPVFIDFWASWCGPCQMMGPVFEELSKEFKGKIKFAKISTEEEPELARKFNVMSIPTLVFISNKKEKNRIIGFSPKQELKEKIKNLL